MSAGIGIAPVSSMAAVALRAAASGDLQESATVPVYVCLDARMNEVYLAQYRWVAGQLETVTPEQLLRPEDVRLPEHGDWLAVGSGFSAHPLLHEKSQAGGARIITSCEPRAAELLPFAHAALTRDELVSAEQWRADYLRDESAWRKLE